VDRGTLKGIAAVRSCAASIREARLALGLSQARVGRAVGLDRARVSRIERGLIEDLSIVLAAKLAAVVGLDLVVSLYPAPSHVRDAPQIALLRAFRDRVGSVWSWRFEVGLPIDRDQRAWDAVGTHRLTGLEIAIDAETRIADGQALLRRENLKKRDGLVSRLVLVVAATKRNRRAIDELRDEVAAQFPVARAARSSRWRRERILAGMRSSSCPR
jgi:transcriptional regulator with XRE-family HTH domain